MLTNTEQTTVVGSTLTQTTFHFGPLGHLGRGMVYLRIEQGSHRPSPEEILLAPFFPDPSQRLLAIELRNCGSAFVMKTEVLLRLAQEWGDVALEWEQWRAHSIEVRPGDVSNLWISGPRLFCMTGPRGKRMDVYDFSPQASARHLETTTDRDGMVQLFMRPSIQNYLPWHSLSPTVHCADCGHDSIVFLMVNAPRFPNLTRI